jgi:hypothetical protein
MARMKLATIAGLLAITERLVTNAVAVDFQIKP